MTTTDRCRLTPPAEELRTARDAQAAEIERLLRLAATDDSRRAAHLEDAITLALPMARTVSSRYQRRGVDSDDLAQIAYLGLVKAASRYRPGPETDFRSFAIPTIRGEIRRYFRDMAWMVRPPRQIQNLQTAVNAAESELAVTLHRWPTHQEVAETLGVPVQDVQDAQCAQGCFHPASLDAPLAASRTFSLASTLAQEDDAYELINHVEALRPIVADLPPRDRLILHRRYVDRRTQAEIGAELGVSQMQVSRLLRSILTLVKAALTA